MEGGKEGGRNRRREEEMEGRKKKGKVGGLLNHDTGQLCLIYF